MANCKHQAAGCGGCAWLGTPYPAQLAQKRALLQRLLAPCCRAEAVLPVLGMEMPEHYRCKAVATFRADAHGRLLCGMYESGTHHVISADDCLLQNEAATRAVHAVCTAAQECRYTAFDEDRGTGLLRHVLVRYGLFTGQLMAVLVTAQPILPGSKRFTARVRALCPELTTLVQSINERRTTFVLGDREKVLYGSGFIEDKLCGCTFRISPSSFYQVNPLQAQVLYRRAIELAGLDGTQSVIDAYCGTGTIGIAASGAARAVTGVELNPAAVRDAQQNARRNHVGNIRFLCRDAGNFLAQCAAQHERVDAVLLDPPRSGSSPAFLQALCLLQPAKVVYVSCGPDTLARDAAFLCKNGYRVTAVQPVDLFPHTPHVEAVCLLERTKT